MQKVRKGSLTDARLSSELCRLKMEVKKSRLLGFGKCAASQRVLAGDEEAAALHAVSGKCHNSSYVTSSPLQQILVGRQHCGKMTSVTTQEGQSCQGSWALQPSRFYLSDSSLKDAHSILRLQKWHYKINTKWQILLQSTLSVDLLSYLFVVDEGTRRKKW